MNRVESLFRVGEFRVLILNYTDELKENEVNEFEIEVESLWNEDIEEVYAEVIVNRIAVFSTPIVLLNAWERKTLVGYFDSTGFDYGDFRAEVVLYYDEGLISESVDLNIAFRIWMRRLWSKSYCAARLAVLVLVLLPAELALAEVGHEDSGSADKLLEKIRAAEDADLSGGVLYSSIKSWRVASDTAITWSACCTE